MDIVSLYAIKEPRSIDHEGTSKIEHHLCAYGEMQLLALRSVYVQLK